MTGIVVSKRDGIVRAPDGTQHRVHRGKTLAHAAHPVVVAYPNDWMPVAIDLVAPGDADGGILSGPDQAAELALLRGQLEEARNELAEVEELAESRGAELQRLADGLAANGVPLPADDEREQGWLVDLAIDVVETWRMDNGAPPAEVSQTDAGPDVTPYPPGPTFGPEVTAPRAPRKRPPAR